MRRSVALSSIAAIDQTWPWTEESGRVGGVTLPLLGEITMFGHAVKADPAVVLRYE